MQWNRWYVAKSYLNSALWIVPLVALLLENVVIRLVFVLHNWLDWIPWFGSTVTGATEALNTVEALTTAFIVFTFGSLLIVVQVASGQLTPRLIATTLLRNNVIRFTVGLFTFTMMFAVGTAARFDTEVPRFAVTIAWVLGIASIAAFFFLIDYTARSLRPVSIVGRIAENEIKVIESVYPEMTRTKQIPPTPVSIDANARAVNHLGRSAIVLAVNLKSLVARASIGRTDSPMLTKLADIDAPGPFSFPEVGTFEARRDPALARRNCRRRSHGQAPRGKPRKARALTVQQRTLAGYALHARSDRGPHVRPRGFRRRPHRSPARQQVRGGPLLAKVVCNGRNCISRVRVGSARRFVGIIAFTDFMRA